MHYFLIEKLQKSPSAGGSASRPSCLRRLGDSPPDSRQTPSPIEKSWLRH